MAEVGTGQKKEMSALRQTSLLDEMQPKTTL